MSYLPYLTVMTTKYFHLTLNGSDSPNIFISHLTVVTLRIQGTSPCTCIICSFQKKSTYFCGKFKNRLWDLAPVFFWFQTLHIVFPTSINAFLNYIWVLTFYCLFCHFTRYHYLIRSSIINAPLKNNPSIFLWYDYIFSHMSFPPG